MSSPQVTITADGDFPLLSGESLVLTCSASITDKVDDCVEFFARWLRADSGEVISSAPPIKVHNNTTFKIEHRFESLSKEDTDKYKCEANLMSTQAGLLATATESVNINVTGMCVSKYASNIIYYPIYTTIVPVTYGYVQLLIVGVTKCSEWVVSTCVNSPCGSHYFITCVC